MDIIFGEFDKLFISETKEEKKTIYLNTRLSFLKEHNGFRPGLMHILLGLTSGGKSTLVRSIIKDVFFNNFNPQKIYVWLSEESQLSFKSEMAISCPDLRGHTLAFISEQDVENHQLNILHFEEYLKEFKPDLFIFDNITTSVFYGNKTPEQQLKFVKHLKSIAIKLRIPFLLVAHTGAEVTENSRRMVNINDIRGTKDAANLAEFFYIMQRFRVEGEYFPTVKIAKNRGYAINNLFHLLNFEQESLSYSRSVNLDFDDFKDAYKSREKI